MRQEASRELQVEHGERPYGYMDVGKIGGWVSRRRSTLGKGSGAGAPCSGERGGGGAHSRSRGHVDLRATRVLGA